MSIPKGISGERSLQAHVNKDGVPYRPKSLTDAVFKQLVEATEVGANIALAARSVNLSPWTVQRWFREAALLIHQGAELDDPEADIRVRLVAAMEGARARRAKEALERIRDAAKDPRNWTAAAWYLERTYPELYGRQDRKPIDYMEELEKLGIDPQKAMEAMIQHMEEQSQLEDGDDVVEGSVV